MNTLCKTLFSVPVLALALAGCNDGAPADSGTMNLAVTDAPIDGAAKVVVKFTGVEFKSKEGPSVHIDYITPKEIDLLALQGTSFDMLLDNQSIPTGVYNWMRLKVEAERDTIDSYLEDESGGQHSLYVPSGSQTGLKLNHAFTIVGGSTQNLTIDFDLRKSVHKPSSPGSDYYLRPSLRLVQDNTVGHITGTVPTAAAAAAGCEGAVYLYEGSGVTPDDVGGSDEPLTTSLISFNTTDGTYEYEIGFVPAGNYTIAFTCDADNDDPETNDSIPFVASGDVSVTAGHFTTYNFPEP